MATIKDEDRITWGEWVILESLEGEIEAVGTAAGYCGQGPNCLVIDIYPHPGDDESGYVHSGTNYGKDEGRRVRFALPYEVMLVQKERALLIGTYGHPEDRLKND